MKIEIIEVYPLKIEEETENVYSMHIYLPDLDLDMRGIMVKFVKKWIFPLPIRTNYDPESKKKVNFPFVSFANKKTNDDFKMSLSEEGTKYMQEKYAEIQKNNALISLKKKKKEKKQPIQN